jgi:VWFA-related protein
MLVVATTIIGATAPLQVVGTQQRPTFKTGVDLIEIQVTATDKDGHPVRGLKAADFVVLENGVARPVIGFEAVSSPPPMPKSVAYPAKFPRDIADNATSSPEMLIALMVDENVPRDRLPRVQALARHVTLSLPADVPMAFLAPNELWEVEFTLDRARILRRLDRITEVSAVKPIRPRVARNEVGICPFDKVKAAARALISASARRKALIYISPYCSASFEDRLDGREMVEALQRANVGFYGIDPRGVAGYSLGNFPAPNLVGSRGNEGVEAARRQQVTRSWDPVLNAQKALREVAAVTGGVTITNDDDFERAVPRLLEDLSSYYVLGFSPAPGSDKIRKIEVRHSDPALVLRYSRGRSIERPERANGNDALGALSEGVLPVTGLPLKLFAAPVPMPESQMKVMLMIEADLAGSAAGVQARESLEVSVHAADLDRERVTKTVRLTREVVRPPRDADGKQLVQVLTSIELPQGDYQLRVSARSTPSGSEGSVYLPVEVPPNPAANEVLLGGLMIGVQPVGSNTAERPILRRTFNAGEVLRISTQAQRGQKVKTPLQMELTLADADGNVVKSIEGKIPAETVVVPVNASVPLDDLVAGPYLLQLTLSSGKARSSQRVPFEIR